MTEPKQSKALRDLLERTVETSIKIAGTKFKMPFSVSLQNRETKDYDTLEAGLPMQIRGLSIKNSGELIAMIDHVGDTLQVYGVPLNSLDIIEDALEGTPENVEEIISLSFSVEKEIGKRKPVVEMFRNTLEMEDSRYSLAMSEYLKNKEQVVYDQNSEAGMF